MHKTTAKLISVTFMMIISLCLITVSSYAYLVLSSSPVISGVSVTVGGSDTIKLANNETIVLETGEVINIPGYFSGSMDFDLGENLRALRPVSTTDGITWFIPKNIQDEVHRYTPGIIDRTKEKNEYSDEFLYDSVLEYGNLLKDKEVEAKGNYLYMDFWAVSPGKDCVLRVSTGDNEGSYVISAPSVVKTENDIELRINSNNAAAYTRVGFLVNDEVQTDDTTMMEYVNRPQYNEAYKKLKGNYAPRGQAPAAMYKSRFTVYEPNSDWHPLRPGVVNWAGMNSMTQEMDDGDYVVTYPLDKVGNIHVTGDMRFSVAAQKSPVWMMSEQNPEKIKIQERFESFLSFIGDKANTFSEEELMGKFYKNWLRGSYSGLLNMGKFFTKTADLYKSAEQASTYHQYVPQEKLKHLETSGATEDVNIVYLERNVPQRIRMFIYLEGQDVDCVSSSNESNLIVHLELAGGSI